MGLDQGEAVATPDGRYFGDALNVAARIQAIALPGGLSVSGAVYRALDEPALRFRALGAKDLKNIPEHVAVYQFVDLPQAEVAGVAVSLGIDVLEQQGAGLRAIADPGLTAVGAVDR